MKNEIPERDLAQKLDQTVCRYKGVPYWIRIDGTRILLYSIPGNKGPTPISARDPDFDVAGLPLGYMNIDKSLTTAYMTRMPLRRTKQGTAPTSVRVENIPTFQKRDGPSGRDYGPSGLMTGTQGFVDMVLGKFPSIPEALTTLRKAIVKTPNDIHQVAVSREIAMVIDTNSLVHVFYKQELVGWMEPGKNVVHVKNDAMAKIVSQYLSKFFGWTVD